MGLPERDTLNSYKLIITAIKNFRGPDAYVLDTIAKVSKVRAKFKKEVQVDKLSDVVQLLTDLSLNRL